MAVELIFDKFLQHIRDAAGVAVGMGGGGDTHIVTVVIFRRISVSRRRRMTRGGGGGGGGGRVGGVGATLSDAEVMACLTACSACAAPWRPPTCRASSVTLAMS